MPRNKKDFGAGANARIRHMMAKGVGHQEIGAALRASGVDVSDRTVARRVAELKKARAAAPSPAPVAPKPRAARVAKAPVEDAAEPIVEPPSPVAEPVALPPLLPPVDVVRATPKDRQIDELLSTSLVWRRIQAAIASALASHPIAGAAVIRALRGVQL